MAGAGYKLVILLKARHGLTAEGLAEAWVQVERQDGEPPTGMLRYAFDAGLAGPSPIENAPAAPFDAAVETWWDKKNSAADWVVSRTFAEQWLPRRLELLASQPTAIGGIPQLIWERPEPVPESAVKVLTLPVASRRLRFPEFADHWTGHHARLALGGPHTKERLLRLEDMPAPTPATSRFAAGFYDGV